MRIHKDVISGLVILLFCGIGALSTSQLPPPSAGEWAGPSTMPAITLAVTALCGILLILEDLLRRKADARSGSFNINGKVLAFYAFFVLYMLGMVCIGRLLGGVPWLGLPHNGGFIVATLFFLLIALPVLGRRKPLEIISVAVVTTGVLVIAFGCFFQILLP